MNGVGTAIRKIVCISAAALVSGIAGCGFGGPRARWGYTPTGSFGNPENLGTHSYGFGGTEGYGIFYTLRGGSIDMDHVRGAADLARAAYEKAYAAMLDKDESFSVGPAFEMTTNTVRLGYPPNWDSLPQTEKEETARQAALIIGPVIGYHSTLWHEMLTWKGTHFALIEPEHESAFSWDDLYSNAVGAKLAAEALKAGNVDQRSYNRAMTGLIDEEMTRLQMVSKNDARRITESVRGEWFTFGKLTKRNMDAGFDDGMISPSIIPGFTQEEPISIPLFTLEGLDRYGIKAAYTISSVYLENGALKQMAGANSDVEPLKHFPIIMKRIEQEAIEKYNYQIR